MEDGVRRERREKGFTKQAGREDELAERRDGIWRIKA